ncbi:MAG: hypothetical protein IPL18_14725 [Sphingomonadales bacterium]|nr:hypothetical protein [Sphingomonadales bacterium]
MLLKVWWISVLVGNATVNYTIDLNNSGTITGAPGSSSPDYNAFVTTATYGAENLLTGNANDTVNMDQSQTGANNHIDLGAQQNNTVTFVEGKDVVNYQDTTATTATVQPTVTLMVEAGGEHRHRDAFRWCLGYGNDNGHADQR